MTPKVAAASNDAAAGQGKCRSFGAGNLYCCGPGGIHVFHPQATCLGVIKVPEYTANFCFGDDDRRSLYVTASSSVYRLRVKVSG